MASKRTVNMMEVRRFNRVVSIRKLLKEHGALTGDESSIYCPFHPDSTSGHKSGKILDDDNVLWCFSEKRRYTPYNVCKTLLKKQMSDFMTYDEMAEAKPKERTPPKIDRSIVEMVRSGGTLAMAAAEIRRRYYATAES